jgi:hypothetical protein
MNSVTLKTKENKYNVPQRERDRVYMSLCQAEKHSFSPHHKCVSSKVGLQSEFTLYIVPKDLIKLLNGFGLIPQIPGQKKIQFFFEGTNFK